MRDKLLTEIMVALRNEGIETLDTIEPKIIDILSKYEISEASMEIILVDKVPEEVKIYLISKSIEGMAQSTLERYCLTLKNFFLFVNKPISQIDCMDVRQYLYYEKNDRKISNATLDSYRRVINSFFDWCVINEYLNRNPCAKITKIRSEEKMYDILTSEEMDELRAACRNPRDRAMVEVYYCTGMRNSELTTIKMQDIDFENKIIHVYNQKSKRDKICFLSNAAIDRLKEYIPTRDSSNDWLFQQIGNHGHGQLNRNATLKAITRIAARCSFDKHVTPITLRRTCATHALNAEMPLEDVQCLLDHKNPKTTQIYAKRELNRTLKSYDKVFNWQFIK